MSSSLSLESRHRRCGRAALHTRRSPGCSESEWSDSGESVRIWCADVDTAEERGRGSEYRSGRGVGLLIWRGGGGVTGGRIEGSEAGWWLRGISCTEPGDASGASVRHIDVGHNCSCTFNTACSFGFALIKLFPRGKIEFGIPAPAEWQHTVTL